MNRRQLVVALGSILAMPSTAWTQIASMPRIAWLSGSSKASGDDTLASLLDGLSAMGYQQDRNFVLETRWAEFSKERAEKLAGELGALRPKVIVATGLAIGVVARLTPSLPMVFVMSGNPVDAGIADSFARPGRNATGVSLLALEVVGKRMDLLKQAVPGMRRVAVLANPEHPGEYRERAASEDAARRLGLESSYFEARDPEELKKALAAIALARPDALFVFGDGLMLQESDSIARFARSHAIPSVSSWAPFARSGFLFTYGPDRPASWRRLAYFVDRILKGANPRDLAIELPTVIELIINQRTATELNLVIPKALLLQATQVIA